MAWCECGPRSNDAMTPRSSAAQRERREKRDQSPVSAYCNGVLDTEERMAFAQLQARNQELRWVLGIGSGEAAVPEVEQQVKEHVARLRAAVGENARLRHDLVQVQASLVENGVPLVAPQSSKGRSFPQAPVGGMEIDPEEQERRSAAVMAEIQTITQSNIELISRCDEEVKALEAQLAAERRRQQMAEVQTKLPPSVRSLTPPRNAAGSPGGGDRTPPRSATALSDRDGPGASPKADPYEEQRQLEEIRRQRAELRQVEEECARLQEAIQQATAKKEQANSRALQELQLAHEVQVEELAHFRRLVEEKRQRSAEKASNPGATPATGTLLEQELQHLQEHLAQVKQRGEQERQAAEAHSAELRQELADLEREQHAVKMECEATLRELEEVKRASNEGRRTPTGAAASAKPLEMQRMQGEALAKEIDRTKQRIGLLDAKIEQLEKEAKDIRERANLVLQAVPDRELGGGDPETPEASARLAELQDLVSDRETALLEAKRDEERLQDELTQAQQALDAAKVDAAVMEQKMRLLQSRTS